MNGFLLDTHVWLWMLFSNDKVALRERERLLSWERAGKLHLSSISAWEVAQKQSKGKLRIDGSVESWVNTSTEPGRLKLLELTVTILVAANQLPGEIHGDPADRLLAATARAHDLTLVTRDGPLLRYAAQGHVRAHKI
jgi:PIN domain nuclease of toxin-antitoxin system